jgi:hypothetical protein
MITEQRFPLGRLVATTNAVLAVDPIEMEEAINRHVAADWGDLSDEDRALNEEAISGGGRILSAYVSTGLVRFWIITEADRSATTILLPEDY